MIRRFTIGAILLASIGLAAQDSRTASVTLQAARAAEQIEQDLPKAIGLYERAAKEAGSDRMLAAQILLGLAQAQVKAGRAQDARGTFERILREYADSGEPAAVAKSRLATSAAGGFQEVPADLNVGRDRWLSPDGKQVIASEGGRLIHRNLEGRQDVVLVERDRGLVSMGAWAPDSRRFAFVLVTPSGASEIRIANILTKQVALVVGGEAEPDRLLAWTTTDELFFRSRPSPTSAYWWLAPIDGTAPRKVYTAGGEAGSIGNITPDGSSIVVIKEQHLWLFERKTETLRPLTTGSGTERGPVLSPDGRLISFLSNRDGQWRLYVAAMDEIPILKTASLATIDESALSGGTPAPMYWISSQGVVTLTANRIEGNIYRADRVAGGSEFTTLERLTQDFRESFRPSLSPDGLRVAYRYSGGAATGIGVMDVNGQGERPLLAERAARSDQNRLFWQSGTVVLFYRSALGDESAGIRSVDTGTRTVSSLPHGQVEAGSWAYSRESGEIFFLPPLGRPPLGRRALKARSLADGSERTIADIDGLFDFVICAGTKSIVYSKLLGTDPAKLGATELRQMSLDGGDDRLLQTTENQNGLIPASCSTDGRFLLYFRNRPHVLNFETGQDRVLPNVDGIDWDEQGTLARDGSFVLVSGSIITTERRSWSGVTYDAVKRLAR